jgi:hypothetical protein
MSDIKDSRRIAKIVEASAPDPDRPKLADEYERALYESDRARAGCYAELEAVTAQLKVVADELASGDGIPLDIDEEEENSLVTTIESVRSLSR